VDPIADIQVIADHGYLNHTWKRKQYSGTDPGRFPTGTAPRNGQNIVNGLPLCRYLGQKWPGLFNKSAGGNPRFVRPTIGLKVLIGKYNGLFINVLPGRPMPRVQYCA